MKMHLFKIIIILFCSNFEDFAVDNKLFLSCFNVDVCNTVYVYFFLYIVQVVQSIVLYLPNTCYFCFSLLKVYISFCRSAIHTGYLEWIKINCLILMYGILMCIYHFFNLNNFNISLNCCKYIRVLNLMDKSCYAKSISLYTLEDK